MTFRVQQPVFQDGAGNDTIAYRDIAVYQQLPKDDVRIEIKAGSKPAIAGYEVYQSGAFDRLGDADANDFRWLANMNDLHGGALRPAAERSHPLSKMYIGNGVFYTHTLRTDLYFERVEKDANRAAARRQPFGCVGETIGVKIEADEVTFTIRIDGDEKSHSLRRVEGLPFRIDIKNMDHSDNAVYSDMAEYYTYLSIPGGKQVDLAPVFEDAETAGGGSVNQIEFCHPIFLEMESIDDL